MLRTLALVLVCSTTPVAAQCVLDRLAPPDAFEALRSDDPARFGVAVAIDGDVVVVGSVSGLDTGSAYVFERSGTLWSSQVELATPTGLEPWAFGSAVAVDGDTLAVGAPLRELDGESLVGSATVFARTPAGWASEGELFADDAAQSSQFGSAVALRGDTLFVAAEAADTVVGASTGAVYVFERTGTVWQQTQKLVGASLPCCSEFGAALAVDDDTLLVGARKGVGSNQGGSVTVFTETAGLWSETDVLVPLESAAFDRFGHAVALDGDRALVGGPTWTDAGTGVVGGAAWIFQRSGSSWSQTVLLGAGASGDSFGSGVALGGDRAAVGARHADAAGASSGDAFLFGFEEGAWTSLGSLAPDDLAPQDEFGLAADLSGNDVLLAAPRSFASESQPGATYVFALEGACLRRDVDFVSFSSGGTQVLDLDAQDAAAGFGYFVLGSATGSAPGVPFGSVLLPLNPDAYTQLTVQLAGSGVFEDSVGFLDAAGRATASLHVPGGLPPTLIGLQLYHAYLTFDPTLLVSQASNATTLAIGVP